jgi:hypothetical protein
MLKVTDSESVGSRTHESHRVATSIPRRES